MWLLLVLVAVVGAARGPGDAAKDVMIPDAAKDAQVPLVRATGLTGTVNRLAVTVGPGVAGVLIAVLIGAAAAALGITATFASIAAASLAHRLPRRVTYLAGYALGGAPRFLVLVTGAPLWAVLATFAVSGLGPGFINPIIGAVIYEQIPRPLLGRVIALTDSAAWAGIPVGGLAGGLLIAAAGLSPVLVISGLAYLLVTTTAGLRPEWADMDRARGSNSARPGRGQRTGRRPEDGSPARSATSL